MKLERLPEHLTTAIVTLLGILFAIYCARMSSMGQTAVIATVGVGILLVVVALTARERAWMFIPATWMLGGQIPALPLPFAARELVILSVSGMFMAFIALKVIRARSPFTLLDLLLLLNLLWLCVAYVRNPVGTLAMGSDRVGGRPYFVIFVASLAYWVLARSSMSTRQARRLPIYMLVGTTLAASLSAITFYFPSTIPFFSQFYTGVTTDVHDSDDGLAARQGYMANVGESYVQGLCSYLRPYTLLNPLFVGRFLLFLIAVYALLASGHRSFVVNSALIFLLCSYFRTGISDVVRICAMVFPLIIIVIGMQGHFIQLPIVAQRALSFLPGNWDPQAVADAKASTEWRHQMWHLALSTDKYIENKLLGDGFGFTRREIETMVMMAESNNQQGIQENMMISGAFHSGPISSIRYAGVVGLILYLILAFHMAWYAYKLIRRSENTAFQTVALFLGVPLIIDPFSFILIFGAYDTAIPNALFYGGMLRMLDRSLSLHEQKTELKDTSQGHKRYKSALRSAPLPLPQLAVRRQ